MFKPFRPFAAGAAVLAACFAPALVSSARAQAPEARFAFVIGDDGYEGAPLKTSANDAGLVADTLKQTGFDVTGARNLDQDTLRASFREFLDKVQQAGPGAVAGVYLSGYGAQADGENYFIPVGAKIANAGDLALNAIRVSDLSRALDATPAKARFMALDLAYAGPFLKGRQTAPGLTIVDADPGSLVAFNAAPGMFAPTPDGAYGPYAKALAEAMRIPGLPLNDIFDRTRTLTAQATKGAQTPWDASKIDPAYALTDPAPASAGIDATPVGQIEAARKKPIREFADADAYAAALDRDTIGGYEEFLASYPRSKFAKNARGLLAARREALTWRRAVNLNSPNGFWTYLSRYPNGPHVVDARRRLERLAAAEAPPAEYAPAEYDIAPPPPDEAVYFANGEPVYYDAGGAPPDAVAFYAPAPAWWAPPPPPVYAEDQEEVYFLPETAAPPPPPWWALPRGIVGPATPYDYDRDHRERARVFPYVAIPAALAAGIIAGKLISNQTERRQAGVTGFGPPPAGGFRPPAPQAGARPAVAAKPFLPPIAATPQTLTRAGLTGQGAPAPQGATPGVNNRFNQPNNALPGQGAAPTQGSAPGANNRFNQPNNALPGQGAAQPQGSAPGANNRFNQPNNALPAQGARPTSPIAPSAPAEALKPASPLQPAAPGSNGAQRLGNPSAGRPGNNAGQTPLAPAVNPAAAAAAAAQQKEQARQQQLQQQQDQARQRAQQNQQQQRAQDQARQQQQQQQQKAQEQQRQQQDQARQQQQQQQRAQEQQRQQQQRQQQQQPKPQPQPQQPPSRGRPDCGHPGQPVCR